MVAGAPKCGTTSIYAALADHPEVSMCYLKEPHFWASDLPGRQEVRDEETYSALFGRHRGRKVCGEASTLYCYSSTAIPSLIRARPDIRVVMMVRDPIDIFQSFHNELLKNLDECEPDAERAWNLQDDRRRGVNIPRLCKEPKMLDYRGICSVGQQLRRLRELLPAEQLMVISLGDLLGDPSLVLQNLARFLGVSTDHGLHPRHENAFGIRRSSTAVKLVRYLYVSPRLNMLRIQTKPILNTFGIRPVKWLFRFNTKIIQKPTLRPEFRARLASEFAPDVALLKESVGLSLAR